MTEDTTVNTKRRSTLKAAAVGVAGPRRASDLRGLSCDLTRAFASLDKIKSDVGVWCTSDAQCEQMLTSGK